VEVSLIVIFLGHSQLLNSFDAFHSLRYDFDVGYELDLIKDQVGLILLVVVNQQPVFAHHVVEMGVHSVDRQGQEENRQESGNQTQVAPRGGLVPLFPLFLVLLILPFDPEAEGDRENVELAHYKDFEFKLYEEHTGNIIYIS
jgi:hypothetical protein